MQYHSLAMVQLKQFWGGGGRYVAEITGMTDREDIAQYALSHQQKETQSQERCDRLQLALGINQSKQWVWPSDLDRISRLTTGQYKG